MDPHMRCSRLVLKIEQSIVYLGSQSKSNTSRALMSYAHLLQKQTCRLVLWSSIKCRRCHCRRECCWRSNVDKCCWCHCRRECCWRYSFDKCCWLHCWRECCWRDSLDKCCRHYCRRESCWRYSLNICGWCHSLNIC